MTKRWMLAGLIAGSCAVPAAADDFPDMTGQWQGRVESVVIDLAGDADAMPFELAIVLAIDWQEGGRFAGVEVSHEKTVGGETVELVADERLAGVFGPEPDHIVLIDENGERTCVLAGMDAMTCVYRHFTEKNAVVTRESWTRLP